MLRHVLVWRDVQVTVTFVGGQPPFVARGTKNCSTCCADMSAHTIDLDVSTSSQSTGWINSTRAQVDPHTGCLTVRVDVPRGEEPRRVRHTAASIFPQCAMVGVDGLPATPFALDIQLI